MTKEDLIKLLRTGDESIYSEVGDLLTLNDYGCDLCEEHEIEIDVDAYGCTYAPDYLVS
jgi:hypothetical protein